MLVARYSCGKLRTARAWRAGHKSTRPRNARFAGRQRSGDPTPCRRAPMQLWLINVWRILGDWLRAALNNAQAVRRSRMLPAWLAVTGVAIDFGLMGLWFRHA